MFLFLLHHKDYKKYMLYDNKLSSPDPTSVILGRLRDSLSGIGYEITVGRGDYHKETRP